MLAVCPCVLRRHMLAPSPPGRGGAGWGQGAGVRVGAGSRASSGQSGQAPSGTQVVSEPPPSRAGEKATLWAAARKVSGSMPGSISRLRVAQWGGGPQNFGSAHGVGSSRTVPQQDSPWGCSGYCTHFRLFVGP